MSDPSTIIIRAPNWVGDCVMATPTLAALRKGFPEAHVILLCRGRSAEIFEGGPWFDDLVRLPHPKASGRVRKTLALTRDLRRRRADLGVLLTNSFRSALLMSLARPREILGYHRNGRGFLLNRRVEALRENGEFVAAPMVGYYLKLAAAAGCPASDQVVHLATTPAEEAGADALFDSLSVRGERSLVGFNVGAAFGSAKCWPPEHFVELAQRLAERKDTDVLVLCGPRERDTARDIVVRADRGNVKGVHELDVPLGTLKAVIRRLALLVTGDSGPRHFAAAFNVPAVTLFGPTDERWSETNRSNEIKIARDLDCRPCMLRVCPRDHECMQDICPGKVWEAVEMLLESSA